MSSARLWAVPLLVVAATSLSCASSHAPRRWLDEPDDVPRAAYGGWIDITLKGQRAAPVEGEFIAIAGTDSVFVLTDGGLRAVPMASIKKARVAVYQSAQAGWLTFSGTVASLSHGLGFIISGPIWILVGSIAAGSVSREPLHDVPDATWSEVAIYARFPQGLPPALDRAALRAKVKPPYRIIVTLKDGSVLRATRVQYSETLGYLTVEVEDGRTEHIGAVHIRSITHPDGKDVTKEIIRR